MHQTLPFLLAVVVLIVLIEILAKKIKVAYPILLVLAGLLISTIPMVPKIKLDPDWIFFIFLPPLLFDAAWSISTKGLIRWWRIIGSFSFLVVFFTATSVALFANHFIPGFSLAMGFLLGAIVSPPDAVSAGAILKFVKIPKTTATILEGESLFNDASSLIIFRFALIAVGTGQFVWGQAVATFGWMVLAGVGTGLLLAWILVEALKRLPTDAPSDIALTLVAPYLFYWVAEQLHCSGVMAVVTGGLFMSTRRLIFLNSESRVRGLSFWESFVFILNGLVFFIIGLDITEVVEGLQIAGIPISTGVLYGTMVTAFIIFIRIISSYIAQFFTYLFRRNILAADFSFRRTWRVPLVLGWTGMRGVVTLAAACSIPTALGDGTGFPQRELILFISFVVIILTLFVQGLTLPYILKQFDLNSMIPPQRTDEEKRSEIRRGIVQHSINHMLEKHQDHISESTFLASTLTHWQQKLDATEEQLMNAKTRKIYIDVLDAQRQFLITKNQDPDMDEDLIRNQTYLIDLEEERIKAL
ncbi:Na+/H+ antiporter [Salmonirosea aquatica]|uniref:Na+/H+ antiporter n=1 Tax=Salmonirosea aquatica TaxID=2654236 RepID=A0A7C9FZP1_9BACT|nr:Na+/H+ antiporter [Cytophagaceae bacterium SJW1-29]